MPCVCAPGRAAWRPGLCVLTLGLFIFANHVPAAAEILDRVVALINEDVITLSELQEALEIFEHQVVSEPVQEREKKALERRVLEELIDKKLMENYAATAGIDASAEEISRAIKDVLSRTQITEDQLRMALAKDGISFDEYSDQIRDQIIKAKLVQQEIRSRISLNEEDIEGYYLNHPDEFRADQGFVLRHILLPLVQDPTPEMVAATRSEANRILEQIRSGMPFEEAAAQFSKDPTAAGGGWLGFFKKGTLSPEMEGAIAGLEEGQISEPVRTPMGIHIIKLEEKTTGKVRKLEKVRDKIRERLYEEAAEQQFERWRKELRKNAYVKVYI